MIKLGFYTAILSELSLEEVVNFAAAEGFACIEVMCWPLGKAERRYAGVTQSTSPVWGEKGEPDPSDSDQCKRGDQCAGILSELSRTPITRRPRCTSTT